jgi:hypothetical protein
MTPLCKLSVKYGSDKNIVGYTPVYYRLLKDRKVKKVLEIGISGLRALPNNVIGASLWMWHDFFSDAQIYGIDIDPRFMLNADRIRSFVADQTKRETLLNVVGATGGDFDVIIDDGLHDPFNQIVAANCLLPFLAKGGTYFIEDIYVDPAAVALCTPRGLYRYRAFLHGEEVELDGPERHFGEPPAGQNLLMIENSRSDA